MVIKNSGRYQITLRWSKERKTMSLDVLNDRRGTWEQMSYSHYSFPTCKENIYVGGLDSKWRRKFESTRSPLFQSNIGMTNLILNNEHLVLLNSMTTSDQDILYRGVPRHHHRHSLLVQIPIKPKQ